MMRWLKKIVESRSWARFAREHPGGFSYRIHFASYPFNVKRIEPGKLYVSTREPVPMPDQLIDGIARNWLRGPFAVKAVNDTVKHLLVSHPDDAARLRPYATPSPEIATPPGYSQFAIRVSHDLHADWGVEFGLLTSRPETMSRPRI
jgi:hypothetical protein